MENPFAPLMDEHRLIDSVNDAFESWADGVVRQSGLDGERAELLRFLTFAREFVDGSHHRKEEDIVFGALREHGSLLHPGSLEALAEEHVESRNLLEALERLADQPATWTATDRQGILQSVRSYVALMYRHTTKEDTVLFPLARARLPARVLGQLRARLGVVDDGDDTGVEPDPLRLLGETLARTYGASLVLRSIPWSAPGRTIVR